MQEIALIIKVGVAIANIHFKAVWGWVNLGLCVSPGRDRQGDQTKGRWDDDDKLFHVLQEQFSCFAGTNINGEVQLIIPDFSRFS
ncbi:MAG: hypothetical protein HC929_13605 [Leptolyngbyaceae cyanobacterium SM2_5_2]|nr:hypothetical protein [Leptolyngbyaceae cyanobacterium SM2_5_2]